ncbi:MAG: hypothetical protein IJ857_00100 [Lachnospiraceae bacterium]|nr:hypothetical protein [Lachnospiraceae bacterium]
MKKKALTLLLSLTLGTALLYGCGGGSEGAAEVKEEKVEEVEEKAPEAEEPEAEEPEAEEAEESGDSSSDGTFSLLDVDDTMVDVGVYGNDSDGTELVFTMFTGPDGNKYVSLIGFDNNSESGDVICGQYEATTETDEDGDEWTYFDVADVYTGDHFNLGLCERPETEEVVFFNKSGDVIEGKFLSAEETINYMGSAVSLLS